MSKVNLGFHRMSEDVDLVLPGEADRRKRTNAIRMAERNKLRRAATDELASVLRIDAPAFALESMLHRFEALWRT